MKEKFRQKILKLRKEFEKDGLSKFNIEIKNKV